MFICLACLEIAYLNYKRTAGVREAVWKLLIVEWLSFENSRSWRQRIAIVFVVPQQLKSIPAEFVSAQYG